MTTDHGDKALDAALQRVAKTEQNSRRATIFATLIPVALGLAFLVFTYSQVSTLLKEKKGLTTEVEALRGEDRDLQKKIADKQQELKKLQEQVGALVGRLDDNLGSIEEGVGAAVAAARLTGSAGQTTRRSQITITQYEKDLKEEVDLDVVLRSLKQFGFQIEPKESLLPVPTNALWFGKDVEDDDVRLVALTLMAAGVDIRWISRFQDFEGPKRARIEIGSWTKVTEFRPWTTQEVADIPQLAEIGNPANPGFRPE